MLLRRDPLELEPPIRAELFGVERLEQHAESLAVAQRVLSSGRGRRLSPRVEDNGHVLRESYRVIANGIREERAITPAAEWLVDNFHIVDEQLREIRDDLPPGYYRELPKLAEGPLAGYPRVYGIAWAFVAHSDSRFDPEALRRFLHAYQRVQPLTVGELWAVAITLRIVLVENLRRLAQSIVRARAARQEADTLADAVLGVDAAAGPTASGLARFEGEPLVTAFAVQLVQRLREQDRAATPALLWLDRRLHAQGTTPDEIVRLEHQRQAAMNVTVRNVIMSMTLISALDWTEFFESVSLVDEVLQTAAGYGAMDFATRDAYRHAVEDLARGSGRSELDVAREAVAQRTGTDGDDHRRRDPGFRLIGSGRVEFERVLGYRPSVRWRLLRIYIAAAAPGYFGTLAILSGVVVALPLLAGGASGADPVSRLVLALLALIPASDLAIALLNRSVSAVVPPRVLPRLDLHGGVPADLRSMVVVPMLLTDAAEVDKQVERLEVHYLANPDGHVHFAVLSDWIDASAERMPDGDETLAAARAGIARLNRRHGPAFDGGDRFLLFHRRRRWNSRERLWMGWERKRGKLNELNRLLRGVPGTSFLPTGSTAPVGVRYVITLDADTRLPRGTVDRLVGTMAHPLNRPRLDPASGRVVDGYAVLQPRVTPPLPGVRSSFFQRLSSGPAGIDPYASAVSDVYQDLWGEGSYTGKGIYDVDAFEAALARRVPDNTLLSHDLLEGVYARAGLVTDVELFESAPAHYGVAAARQHRWARGDWQLLPYIVRSGLPAIGRWKMLDNLRRTLSAPAAFLTLLMAWLVGTSPAVWSAFIVATIAGPAILPVLGGAIPRKRGISKRSHVRAVGRDVRLAASHVGVTAAMLAYQAWLMSDAIVRTVMRVYVTRRHLLEWVTAAQAKAGLRLDLRGFCRRMAGGVLLAVASAVLVLWPGRRRYRGSSSGLPRPRARAGSACRGACAAHSRCRRPTHSPCD
jgi:cyclic beta-1,2-glucan synthetase